MRVNHSSTPRPPTVCDRIMSLKGTRKIVVIAPINPANKLLKSAPPNLKRKRINNMTSSTATPQERNFCHLGAGDRLGENALVKK